MTITFAQAAAEEAEHVAKHNGKPVHIYNPHGVSVETLPIIYGFNNGGRIGWQEGIVIAEDGTQLGNHVCSSEAYMLYDLAILEGCREEHHEAYRAHYPDGYRMEFVPFESTGSHKGLDDAVQKFMLSNSQPETKQ